jgi:catechol 2,3-dioxygenase-like lactoylglutathione lyase family enzyme
MTAVISMGNHSSVLVPHQDRERIREFYCDVLGGEVTKADPERDFVRLGGDFYIAFLYGDVADESTFLRTARAIWLEIRSEDVAETRRAILACGLVRQLEVPDPHLYFQAPGGQCLRLFGTDEDLSFYEGAGAGPDVARVKAAISADGGRETGGSGGSR